MFRQVRVVNASERSYTRSTFDRNGLNRTLFSAWNGIMFVLAAFFCYVVISNWVNAFANGNYQGVGISLFLLLLIAFACWRSRSIVLRNTERRMMMRRHAADMNARIFVDIPLNGVPPSVRNNYDIFQNNDNEMENNEADECSICLSMYVIDEYLCRVPCPSKHLFHRDCINLWLDSHQNCPLCKFDLLEDNSERV
mmetsp:Transcript_2266/g.3225  ORF Transcript_2266/g.3225 Transcript_2266/m.3225 type:complete len:196 (+) Transcript_2266:99-686(+)